MKTGVCTHCGSTIYLIVSGQSGHWVTNPNKAVSNHCGGDPDKPIRVHAPKDAS